MSSVVSTLLEAFSVTLSLFVPALGLLFLIAFCDSPLTLEILRFCSSSINSWLVLRDFEWVNFVIWLKLLIYGTVEPVKEIF
jgi:hypothetical protein